MSFLEPTREEDLFSFKNPNEALQQLENLPRPSKLDPSAEFFEDKNNGPIHVAPHPPAFDPQPPQLQQQPQQPQQPQSPQVQQKPQQPQPQATSYNPYFFSSSQNPSVSEQIASPPSYHHQEQEETHTPISYGGYPKMMEQQNNNTENGYPSFEQNDNKILDILSRYNPNEQQQQVKPPQSPSWSSPQQPQVQAQPQVQPQVQPQPVFQNRYQAVRPLSAPATPMQTHYQQQQQLQQQQLQQQQLHLQQQQQQLQQQQLQQQQVQSSYAQQTSYPQVQPPREQVVSPKPVINSAPATPTQFQSYPQLPQQWQAPAIGTTKQEIKMEEVKQQQQQMVTMIEQMNSQFSKIMNFMETVDRRLTKLERSTQDILTAQSSNSIPIDTSELLHATQQMQQLENDMELARQLQEELNESEPKKRSTSTPTPRAQSVFVEKKKEEPKKSNMIDCPVCAKKIPEKEIDDHVNVCLDNNPDKAEKSGLLGRFFSKKTETPKPEPKKDEKKSASPTPSSSQIQPYYAPYAQPPSGRPGNPAVPMQMYSPYQYPSYMMPNGQVVYYANYPQNGNQK